MPPPLPLTQEEITDITSHHNVTADQQQKMERINAACAIMIKEIVNNAPQCADTTHAVRQVRDARMWANQAIALNGKI